MQPDLKEKLEAAATEAGRSLNAEIVARLESSFTGGDQSALITVIARLNADLARADLEKQQLEMQAALVAHSLLKAVDLLKDRLRDNDQEASDLARAFIARATPLAIDTTSLYDEYKAKSEALIQALTEVRRSHYPHSYKGEALEKENARRRQLGLPVYEPSATNDAAADVLVSHGDGSTTLIQAKTVKAPKHDLVKPAVTKRISRKGPVAKKSTKS